MAKVRMSENGTVRLPQEVLDAHGLRPGAEFEVVDGGKVITLELLQPDSPAKEEPKLTVQEFLAVLDKFPRYEGPAITDEMMREAIGQAAIQDWERLERQWNEDKND